MTADASKIDHYQEARRQLAAILHNLGDPIAAMATASSVLFRAIPGVSWVGFYRVVEPDLLRVGPYQGPVGCIEISFGQGVCGAAAATRCAQVVPDVHAFPGHIACDALARSEIVVPVYDGAGDLVAVLDLDSHHAENFDAVDLEQLESIVALISPCFQRSGS